MMEKYGDDIGWCYDLLDDVKAAFSAYNFEFEIHFIEGDVLETLPQIKPETISVLRLDTDWYESTALEFELLYPRLSPGGVLIVEQGFMRACCGLVAFGYVLLFHSSCLHR